MGHHLLQVPLPPPSPSLSDRGVGHDSSAKLLKMEMRIPRPPWRDSCRVVRWIKEIIVVKSNAAGRGARVEAQAMNEEARATGPEKMVCKM